MKLLGGKIAEGGWGIVVVELAAVVVVSMMLLFSWLLRLPRGLVVEKSRGEYLCLGLRGPLSCCTAEMENLL